MIVLPMPRSANATKYTQNRSALAASGRNIANTVMPSETSTVFLRPIFPHSTPVGMDIRKNQMKIIDGRKPAVTSESAHSAFTWFITVPMMSVGAKGVISVASNVIPREMGDMVRLALAGDFVSARALHERFYPLFHDLFIDVNPVMVKEALWLMGLAEREFRLPLCATTDENLARISETLKAVGLPVVQGGR